MGRYIVVGAGPAGLSLALQLARGGAEVSLIEAHPDFSRQFRGDALMPCGQQALACMGLLELVEGLPQRRLEGWSVWVERRRLFEVAEPMGSLQPCTLVPQQRLLEALLEQARQLPNLQWLPGVSVRRLLIGERVEGVELVDGRRLTADLVIACDGRDSRLRQNAGLALRSGGPQLDLLWFELAAPLPAELVWGFNTLLAGGQIGSACRNAAGRLQLAWLLQPGEALPRRSAAEWAEALAALAPAPLAALLLERSSELSAPLRLTVQVGQAQRWHRPGLLLLGDAAHPMSPVRAQGINMALRDALVASRLLLENPGDADGAAAAIEGQRRPEITRMQKLQQAEARQGHWLGHNALLRQGVAALAPLVGPLAQRLWLARQGPLREGLDGVLPNALQRTNSISW